MANSASAIKRIELNERNRLRNKTYKSMLKTYYKKCIVAIETTNHSDLETNNLRQLIAITQSKIDKAVQKGIIHSNNGSAKKAKLTKRLKEKKISL